MKKITLYTDGACAYNPGPGGWGAILLYGKHRKEMSGGERNTTNNRMELTAMVNGLKALKESCEVEIYSDSAYIINAFQQDWLSGWITRGWKNSNKKPVANQDLWQELLLLTKTHKMHWNKVKGHADNDLNNRCDELARGETDKLLESFTPEEIENLKPQQKDGVDN